MRRSQLELSVQKHGGTVGCSMGKSDNDNSSKYVGFDIVFGGVQLSRRPSGCFTAGLLGGL